MDADIIILGASFAGLELIHQLHKRLQAYAKFKPLEILVIDRQDTHGYIPLMHERICGRLTPNESTLPTAEVLACYPHTHFLQGEVIALEPQRGLVHLRDQPSKTGRYIVVALGSEIAPPSLLPGAHHLTTYKFSADSSALAAKLHELREAKREVDQARILVIGGGLSGVELAGELAVVAARDPVWSVSLLEAGPRLLSSFSPRVSRLALRSLERQGVDVRMQARVIEVQASGATVVEQGAHGEETIEVPAALTIWCGGLKPPKILAALGLAQTTTGWLVATSTLQALDTSGAIFDNLFTCGDAARIIDETGQWPTMQRAIECLWQAKVVAKNLVRLSWHPGKKLARHRLRRDFPHGVSLGADSLVVAGPIISRTHRLNAWFRRFLMRRYFARYVR